MNDWKQKIPLTHPALADYRRLINDLPDDRFPNPEDLNWPKATAPRTGKDQALLFSPEESLEDELGYEERIFTRGLVSTRLGNWHDLFNALAWKRFTATKLAFNRLHMEGLKHSVSGRRGPLRDAITLFDECGIVICSSRRDLLDSLAARNWQRAFVDLAGAWHAETRVHLIGHAMLERYLEPYKSMTSQSLLIYRPNPDNPGPIDDCLARELASARLLRTSSDLSPVPLQGIPGWSTTGIQDELFYADHDVFRPPRPELKAAPVHCF